MKPVIGITPDFTDGDREVLGSREPTFFLRARYIGAIEDLGGIPLILPLAEDRATRKALLKDVDGLMLTGSGPDLPPQLYRERQRYSFRVVSRRRYEFELDAIRLAVDRTLPVLGICGGMQALNVALGGSLVQDIPSQVGSPIAHRSPLAATRLCHTVEVHAGTLLRRIIGRSKIRVNSSHHQSVKEIARPLIRSAVAPDGVIEAIESPLYPFVLGVQWHPEFLYDRHDTHRRIFEAFLRASRTRS